MCMNNAQAFIKRGNFLPLCHTSPVWVTGAASQAPLGLVMVTPY